MAEAHWSVVNAKTGKVVEKDLFLSEAQNYQDRLGNLKIRAQAPKEPGLYPKQDRR